MTRIKSSGWLDWDKADRRYCFSVICFAQESQVRKRLVGLRTLERQFCSNLGERPGQLLLLIGCALGVPCVVRCVAQG